MHHVYQLRVFQYLYIYLYVQMGFIQKNYASCVIISYGYSNFCTFICVCTDGVYPFEHKGDRRSTFPSPKRRLTKFTGEGKRVEGKKGKADPSPKQRSTSPSNKQGYTKINSRTNVYTVYEYAQIF